MGFRRWLYIAMRYHCSTFCCAIWIGGIAPVAIVEQGRVAIGDEIGEIAGSTHGRGSDRRTSRPQFAR